MTCSYFLFRFFSEIFDRYSQQAQGIVWISEKSWIWHLRQEKTGYKMCLRYRRLNDILGKYRIK